MGLSFKIECDEDQFHTWCPELTGCHSHGRTVSEAMENLEDAVKLYLDILLKAMKQFVTLSLILFSLTLRSQSFDKKISSDKLKLPNEELAGFSTSFDFSQKKTQLAWWKYAKKFALPKNMRTHYEVTIPATENARSMVIFTQSLGESKPTTFKLGIKTGDMSKEEKQKYSKQAKAMLLDFLRWYYLRFYEELLEELEKSLPSSSSVNWDAWMEYVEKRDAILKKVRGI